MAGPNLTVAVTADVTDLQTKLAAARSAYNASGAELRKMANEARQAGQTLDSTFNPNVAKTAASVAALKAEINQLAADLRGKLKPALDETNDKHKNLQGVIGQNRVAFNELGHSVRAVADGMAAGINPITLFSEEFFRVTQALTEFNTISATTLVKFGLIGVAAMTAAGGVAFLAHRMEEFRDSRNLSAEFSSRGMEVPPQTIESWRKFFRETSWSIKSLSGVTDEARDKMISSFMDIPYATKDMVSALVHITPDLADALEGGDSGKAPEVATEVSKAFTELGHSAEELLLRVDKSRDSLKKFNEAEDDPLQQRVILFKALSQAAKDMGTNINSSAITSVSRPIFGEVGQDLAYDRLADATDRSNEARKAFSEYTQSVRNGGVQIAPTLTAINDQLIQIRQNPGLLDTAKLEKEVALVDKYRNILHDPQLNKLYDSLVYDKTVAASADAMRQIREQAVSAGAQAEATRKDQVAAELSVYKQSLSDARLTAEAKVELQTEINQLQMRSNRLVATESKKSAEEEWQNYSAMMRDKITLAKGNFDQQIALAQQWVADGKARFGQNLHNYENAQQELDNLDNARTEFLKKELEKQATITRDAAQIQANLAKIGSQSDKGEFKPSIGLVFDDSDLQAKVREQIDKLKAALADEMGGGQQAIKLDLQVGDQQGALSELVKLSDAYANTMEKITSLNDQATKAVEASWDKISGPITNAMESAFGAILKGGRNTRQELAKAAEGIAESWVKSGFKMLSDWIAMELRKTFFTQAAVQTRSAAEDTGAAQLITKLAQQLGVHIATETGKTGATVAGVAARTTAEVTGAAAGKAAKAAVDGPSIMGDAARAAAGAYAATAEIPIIGPVLAPAAAAVAFGAVAAYQSVASAEGGWERVPNDGAPAILHKNEMVLPASVADNIRSMTQGGYATPRSGVGRLAGSSSIVNRSGDSSHTVNINQTNTVHATGNVSPGDITNAMTKSNQDLHSTVTGWYGNNSVSLPGRRTWR